MWDDNESVAHKHIKHTPKKHCGILSQRNYSMKHDVLAADGVDGPIECCWVHLWVHLVWQGTKAAESGFLIEDTEPKIKIMHMAWPIGQHRKVHSGHRIPSGCFLMLCWAFSTFGRGQKQGTYKAVSEWGRDTRLRLLSMTWERYQCTIWHHNGISRTMFLDTFSEKWRKQRVDFSHFCRVHWQGRVKKTLVK